MVPLSPPGITVPWWHLRDKVSEFSTPLIQRRDRGVLERSGGQRVYLVRQYLLFQRDYARVIATWMTWTVSLPNFHLLPDTRKEILFWEKSRSDGHLCCVWVWCPATSRHGLHIHRIYLYAAWSAFGGKYTKGKRMRLRGTTQTKTVTL